MNLPSRTLSLFVLLAAGTLITTGCGKSRTPEATLTEAAVTGSWLELPREELSTARRAQNVEVPKFLRHVTLNADKTFVFSLRTVDGGTTKDDKKAEGTWEIDVEQNAVVFTITKNGFKSSDPGSDMVPKLLAELDQREVPGKGPTQIIYATDQGDASAKLARQS